MLPADTPWRAVSILPEHLVYRFGRPLWVEDELPHLLPLVHKPTRVSDPVNNADIAKLGEKRPRELIVVDGFRQSLVFLHSDPRRWWRGVFRDHVRKTVAEQSAQFQERLGANRRVPKLGNVVEEGVPCRANLGRRLRHGLVVLRLLRGVPVLIFRADLHGKDGNLAEGRTELGEVRTQRETHRVEVRFLYRVCMGEDDQHRRHRHHVGIRPEFCRPACLKLLQVSASNLAAARLLLALPFDPCLNRFFPHVQHQPQPVHHVVADGFQRSVRPSHDRIDRALHPKEEPVRAPEKLLPAEVEEVGGDVVLRIRCRTWDTLCFRLRCAPRLRSLFLRQIKLHDPPLPRSRSPLRTGAWRSFALERRKPPAEHAFANLAIAQQGDLHLAPWTACAATRKLGPQSVQCNGR